MSKAIKYQTLLKGMIIGLLVAICYFVISIVVISSQNATIADLKAESKQKDEVGQSLIEVIRESGTIMVDLCRSGATSSSSRKKCVDNAVIMERFPDWGEPVDFENIFQEDNLNDEKSGFDPGDFIW